MQAGKRTSTRGGTSEPSRDQRIQYHEHREPQPIERDPVLNKIFHIVPYEERLARYIKVRNRIFNENLVINEKSAIENNQINEANFSNSMKRKKRASERINKFWKKVKLTRRQIKKVITEIAMRF